jgi:hypothetical protein
MAAESSKVINLHLPLGRFILQKKEKFDGADFQEVPFNFTHGLH